MPGHFCPGVLLHPFSHHTHKTWLNGIPLWSTPVSATFPIKGQQHRERTHFVSHVPRTASPSRAPRADSWQTPPQSLHARGPSFPRLQQAWQAAFPAPLVPPAEDHAAQESSEQRAARSSPCKGKRAKAAPHPFPACSPSRFPLKFNGLMEACAALPRKTHARSA